MKQILVLLAVLVSTIFFTISTSRAYETDTFDTLGGPLKIGFLGHASLLIEFNGKNIYIDPCSQFADFSKLPKADIVLFTHEHKDHFDMEALEAIRSENTLVVLTESCVRQYQEGLVMRNEDVKIVQGIKIEGVPAYNIVHKRPSGFPYHPKGIGNGYIITFGDKRVYIAGDTEKIPEMNELSEIDIAFLPVNLPYTMTVEMAADAVKAIRPKVFYPYHYGETDLSELEKLLKPLTEVEMRVRDMK
ncbi:MAG: MBL fold metallo-hydrolase [Syntrophobacteraceae bacterium]